MCSVFRWEMLVGLQLWGGYVSCIYQHRLMFCGRWRWLFYFALVLISVIYGNNDSRLKVLPSVGSFSRLSGMKDGVFCGAIITRPMSLRPGWLFVSALARLSLWRRMRLYASAIMHLWKDSTSSSSLFFRQNLHRMVVYVLSFVPTKQMGICPLSIVFLFLI